MILLNQLLKSIGAAEASNHFHFLTKKEETCAYLVSNLGINGKLCPIFHWNAIWHHRIAVEISAQLFEDSDKIAPIRESLKVYRENYNRMYSTMPLRSNKSFSYYLGAIALDAINEEYNEKNFKTFYRITKHLVGDGAFIEGSHYSLFCSQSFDRIRSLLQSFYKENILWKDLCEVMEKLEDWQRIISNNEGVIASIGDSWYEKVEPSDKTGMFSYKDMTVHKNKRWTIVRNHRKSPWALHEHPHLTEVLVAKDDEWIVQGSGMPSYKHIMSNPIRWRRPRNHFYIEPSFDFIWLWRLCKSTNKVRMITLNEDDVSVYDDGFLTIRWPFEGNYEWKTNSNEVTFKYKNGSFKVRGNIDNVKKGFSWQSTSYRKFKKVDVIRIEGRDLTTIIK